MPVSGQGAMLRSNSPGLDPAGCCGHWSQKNGHLLLVMVIFHKGLKYLSKVGDVSCVEICTIHMEVTGVIGVSQNHRSHG